MSSTPRRGGRQRPPPIIWLAATRTTRMEKLLLALARVAPFGATMLAEAIRLQVACLVLCGLLWLVWRRLPARAGRDLRDSPHSAPTGH